MRIGHVRPITLGMPLTGHEEVLAAGEAPPDDVPARRDSDWDGVPRARQDDIAWGARRAAVTIAAATLDACDGGTGSHSDDVVHLSDAIATTLGVYGDERAELLAAAQLHDIGKVGIPHEVLHKPAALDDREWALMRDHTIIGERIIRSVPELGGVARLVRHSHERWDGGGYPDGLAGDEIPLASRIVFCADAFHAIRSDRPYRRGRNAQAALEEVRRNAGSQFDPAVVEALFKAAADLCADAQRGRGGRGATPRSRRLVALLVTLTVGGSAMANVRSLFAQRDRAPQKSGEPASPRPRAGGGMRATPVVSPPPRPASRAPKPASVKRKPKPAPKAGSAPRGRDDSTTAAPATPVRSAARPAAQARPAAPAATGRPAQRTPSAAKPPPPAPPPAAQPRSRGRSDEAPRRPADPGRPVSGAPGRSDEAPGRPTEPVQPPPPTAAGGRGHSG
jgi:hypothetical protein